MTLLDELLKQSVASRPAIVLLEDFEPIEEYGVRIKAGTAGRLIRFARNEIVEDSALVEFPGLSDWYWMPASKIALASETICARCGEPIPVNHLRAYEPETGKQFHGDCAPRS